MFENSLKNLELSLTTQLDQLDLPFYNFALNDDKMWSEVEKCCRQMRQQFKELVLVGIGGSSLGAQVFCSAENEEFGVHFIDTVEPLKVEKILTPLKERIHEVAFLFISKSGSTVEVLSVINAIFQKYGSQLQQNQVFVVTNNSSNPLHEFAKSRNYRTFYFPEEIGGRFSFFTPVGLIPVGFQRIESLKELREGVRSWQEMDRTFLDLGAFILKAYYNKCPLLGLWAYSEKVSNLAYWLQQIVSESLAKPSESDLCIPLPVVVTGPRDQHSVLQQFSLKMGEAHCFFDEGYSAENSITNLFSSEKYLDKSSLEKLVQVEAEAMQKDFKARGKMVFRVPLRNTDSKTLAQFVLGVKILVVVLGRVLSINPYGQPGVESGKKKIKELLS